MRVEEIQTSVPCMLEQKPERFGLVPKWGEGLEQETTMTAYKLFSLMHNSNFYPFWMAYQTKAPKIVKNAPIKGYMVFADFF